TGVYILGLTREVCAAMPYLHVRHHAHQPDHAAVRAHLDACVLQVRVRLHAIAQRLGDLVVLPVRRLALHVRDDLDRVAHGLHAVDALRDLFGRGPLVARGDLATQRDDTVLRLDLDATRFRALVPDQLHLGLGRDPGILDIRPA